MANALTIQDIFPKSILILSIYYLYLHAWQVNTRIDGARFCEIARTYLQLDLNAILHQHLVFSPKWTSEFDFDESNISVQSTTVWLHDQKFLRTKWKFIAGEEIVHQREITWYWDPVKQVVRNQSFDSDGEWGQATIEIEKNSLHDRREFADKIGDPSLLFF